MDKTVKAIETNGYFLSLVETESYGYAVISYRKNAPTYSTGYFKDLRTAMQVFDVTLEEMIGH